MSLTPLNVRQLLDQHHLNPKKGLGQNFLADHHALEKVIRAAKISSGDTVLEIGAGLGSLTRLLASQVNRVVAVEIDQTLLPILATVLQPFDNVQIIPTDILEVDINQVITGDQYNVVANIPYYITSAVIRHLLEAGHKPQRITLTIQEEVAQRILARDGKMSLLALSVHVFGSPEIACKIPAGCFYPAPNVDSCVLTIDLYPQPLIETQDLPLFFRLAHAGFSQKRKMLRNTFAAGLQLDTATVEQRMAGTGISHARRAETLSLIEWGLLVQAFKAK